MKGGGFVQIGRLPVAAVFWATNLITLRHYLPVGGEWLERLRTVLAKVLGARIGRDSIIRKSIFVTDFSLLRIGERSKLGPYARLFLYETFSIGDNVEIGSGLTVHTAEHQFDDPTHPLTKQGAWYAPVEISDDVYIGSNVILLPGTIIERRVVVGAGAVVSGRLASGHIYAGVPARPLRKLADPSTSRSEQMSRKPGK